MRFAFIAICLLFVVACTPTQIAPEEPTSPTDAQLSSCSSNADCIPLPSQCHPSRCINKEYANSYEKPTVCTEIFLADAAYTPNDCACENSLCINKNDYLAESNLPPGATKCSFRGEVCTMEFRPVCGFFKESIQCIKAPCAITASNPCEACANQDVAYWSEGECDEK